MCRSQWPRGLRRGSAAARLLRLWVPIPPGAWRSVCCECCVLSGRGLCDGLITRPEESYRMWCVTVCVGPGPLWGGGGVAPKKMLYLLSMLFSSFVPAWNEGMYVPPVPFFVLLMQPSSDGADYIIIRLKFPSEDRGLKG